MIAKIEFLKRKSGIIVCKPREDLAKKNNMTRPNSGLLYHHLRKH